MNTYAKEVRSLQATGGSRTCWEIGFPPRCILSRLVVQQVGGSLTPFSVRVYNARKACDPGSSSGGLPEDSDLASTDPETYRVGPVLESDQPGGLHYQYEDYVDYTNRDSQSPSNRRYRIYLEIDLPGSEECTFDVALSCHLLG